MCSHNLYVKRDDELGSYHGSKWRKYASLIPWIRSHRGTTTIALVGSPYSNHIFSFVQLLKQEGIPYCLFLTKPKEKKVQGNFFFLSLFIDKDEIVWIDEILHPLPSSWIKSWEEKLQQNFLWIPLGGAMPAGLPGALTLSLDILHNEQTLDNTFSHIFVDAGTGLTACGLILGMDCHKLRQNTTVHVVLMASTEVEFVTQLSYFRSHLESLLQQQIPSSTQYLLHHPSTSKSFGSCNRSIFQTIQKVAKEEGILLDPLYTTKLFLTTEQTVREKTLQGNILWIHSGGVLSLTGFQNQLSKI